MKYTKHIIIPLLVIFCSLLPSGARAQATAITDSTVMAVFLNGMKEYNMGNLAKAKENFQLLMAIDPQNDAACYYLANIALKTDDAVSCELYLRKGIGMDSSNFWYRDMLGQVYIKNKKLDEAIKVYEELLELYPKKSAVYYSLVNLYMGAQDTENARGMLQKIEAAQGKSEALAMATFNIFRMEQNWEGGLEYLIEFDKEFRSPRIESIIADMYAERYRDSLALEYYNKALKLDPQYAPAMYGKGEVYRLKGDFANYFA
ncbi:MAG: tetratricopeptide repeat protein, partial [Bacteroidales bacterium]|nr:tetratricopeptide repeat protein [Bacteroidales bacterium]